MTPIIDIHDHVFSGKDIPLEGYLYSRRYDEWTIRLLKPLLIPLLAASIRREGSPALFPLEKLVLEFAFQYMGNGYRNWTDIVSLHDVADIAFRLVETYEKEAVDLFVPLMIDFEYWFLNTPDNSIASQVQSVYQNIVLPYSGRIHPFAPFDPAREIAFRKGLPSPDLSKQGTPEPTSSLQLIKDAIQNKGFIGVKVYNSLGYRPLGNAAVDAKRRSIFHRNEMEQYAAFTGEEFDQVLTELYEYCIEEQIPITAHCVSNGIEAYPGASLDFAGPRFWRPVLDRFPDLHLNLAHYGWSRPHAYPPQGLNRWNPRLFQKQTEDTDPDGGKATWTSEISDMLLRYKYLYTDVAHHGFVIEKDTVKFAESYRALCRNFPGILSKRLMYGTDWHVFTRMENFQSFQERYRQLWKQEGIFTDADIENILGGNALQFLGLAPEHALLGSDWTKNRERLGNFYRTQNIVPRDWFREKEHV